MKYSFALIFLFNVSLAYCQKIKFYAGPVVSIPTSPGIRSAAYGGTGELAYPFKNRLHLIAGISVSYFPKDIYYLKENPNPQPYTILTAFGYATQVDLFLPDTAHGFTIMPLSAGFKWYGTKRFYLSPSAGVALGIKNCSSRLVLSPAAGFCFPDYERSRLDIGISASLIPQRSLFSSESDFLHKGGYSFLSLHVMSRLF